MEHGKAKQSSKEEVKLLGIFQNGKDSSENKRGEGLYLDQLGRRRETGKLVGKGSAYSSKSALIISVFQKSWRGIV